jgi:MFS family permease
VRRYLLASALLGFTIMNGIHPVLFNLYLLRLGYGPEFVGWVNAVGTLSYAVFAFPAGLLAPRIGIRRTMTIGLLLCALCYGLLSVVDVVPTVARGAWLMVNRVIAILGLSLYFVNANPFIAGATTEQGRNHAYSVRMVFDSLSGFLGSLVGGVLPGLIAGLLGMAPEQPAAYRYALLIASVLCLPAVWVMASVREVEVETHPERAGKAPGGAIPVALIGAMACVVLLRSSGIGVSRTFFNVYMDDGLGVPTAQIGALFAAIQLFSVPAALLTPSLTARWGAFRVTVVGSFGMAASTLPLALVPHWAAATAGRAGIYALSSIADVAISAYQMALVEPRWRTHMAGATSMAVGVCWTALAVGGGYLIAGLGYRELFLLAGGLTLAGVLLFWLVFRTVRPVSDSTLLGKEGRKR